MYIMQAGAVSRVERGPISWFDVVAVLGMCCCAGLLASLASHVLSHAGVRNGSDGNWE
jgi:hypothetical protein